VPLLCWSYGFLLLWGVPLGEAQVPCSDDMDCGMTFQVGGGKCIEGICTNPYHHNGGCLASMLGDDWKLKNGLPRRVCGSEDPPDAAEKGYCRISPLEEFYTEVRILVLGWESTYFQAWILQILLSEVLQVPVSIETGVFGGSVDFYGINSPLDYPTYDADYAELGVSSEVLDCRVIENKPDQPETYKSCAHVVPEVWQAASLIDSKAEGTGPFRESGMLTSQRWYIPKFTAIRDPSLTTIYGLAGQKNRQKLAQTFKRPTTWKQYCDEVSLNGCTDDDGVASRLPTESEADSMFSEGSYTGHFRYTEANNCTGFPNSVSCTGHFTDYPCGWNSQAPAQIYHNQIALQSDGPNDIRGGYSYSQLVGIWRAANATKENVMIMWWSPEMLFEEFFGTDAEFVPVNLGQPTQECHEHRPPRGSMCDTEYDISSSDPRGACDYTVDSVKKFISDGLYETTYDSAIPEALQSPAYTAIDNYRMTTLQLNQIFQLWLERKRDYNFDARYATCKWVVDNLDHVLSWVPKSHPRSIEEVDTTKTPLFLGALAVACIAAMYVIFSFVNVGMKRMTKVIYFAQFESLVAILTGLLLLSIGTILMVVPHTDDSCVSIAWLVNLGYAIHFAPLVSKVFAINSNLANHEKQMQRVRLSKTQLYRALIALTTLVTVFMVVWTAKKPFELKSAYQLSEETIESGETIVVEVNYCGSCTELWYMLSLTWQAIILFPTAVIAFVACRVKEDINDTKALSLVVYTHSFFLAFRASLFLLDDGSKSAELMAYNSLLISVDIIVVVVIYFFPKFFAKEELNNNEEILPDLFLNSSICMADVMGFAAWSSAREPHQVFKLLETLFESFDQTASKHNVFKVETVSDCYVAATGIPHRQAKHAEIMAKFAIGILKKMDHLSKNLEMMFGPDTGELKLRIGIHSGPVTGGFLRGKGARFQLFGDTMTTASLIHNIGMSNRIHISQATATLLIENGCKRWVTKRQTKPYTAEKGELETYWLTRGIKHLGGFEETASSIAYSDFMSIASGASDDFDLYEDSQMRWIEWNVKVLSKVLKQIIAQRTTSNLLDESIRSVKMVTRLSGVRSISGGSPDTPNPCHVLGSNACSTIEAHTSPLAMPLDELAEIIELPDFDKRAIKRQRDNSSKLELGPALMSQLKEYVTMVASMYKENPFHNFAHASYVVMAVEKYMSRIMAASEVDLGYDGDRHHSATHEALHDHTYGIASDPLTRFACVFSALIHDIDHPGVPNPRFVEENERLSRIYKNRSVAEQNSFDLAWDLLMDEPFALLRGAICPNDVEFRRFRQIVVNSIMATDLGDKQSKELRNGRWKKAFATGEKVQEESLSNAKNRKATIVIEHLIQAADIAHTCQHWGLYRKWNERLFLECYKAYRDGRAEKNPADGWYEGEIGFYDFYIIPLAKKLRDCGVFGPTSDENLNYAKSNRSQWEREGRAIVSKMLDKAEEEYNAQYIEESFNAMTPDSEFFSAEFNDEQIMVKAFDGHCDHSHHKEESPNTDDDKTEASGTT